MTDGVKVLIKASQTVEYQQYKTIPRAIYDKYLAMCEANARDSEFERAFGGLINTSDVCDASDFENLEIVLDMAAT